MTHAHIHVYPHIHVLTHMHTSTYTHTHTHTVPKLEFFNATAEDGGRSILLQWELAFDGGPPVEQFRIEVSKRSIP